MSAVETREVLRPSYMTAVDYQNTALHRLALDATVHHRGFLQWDWEIYRPEHAGEQIATGTARTRERAFLAAKAAAHRPGLLRGKR